MGAEPSDLVWISDAVALDSWGDCVILGRLHDFSLCFLRLVQYHKAWVKWNIRDSYRWKRIALEAYTRSKDYKEITSWERMDVWSGLLGSSPVSPGDTADENSIFLVTTVVSRKVSTISISNGGTSGHTRNASPPEERGAAYRPNRMAYEHAPCLSMKRLWWFSFQWLLSAGRRKERRFVLRGDRWGQPIKLSRHERWQKCVRNSLSMSCFLASSLLFLLCFDEKIGRATR